MKLPEKIRAKLSNGLSTPGLLLTLPFIAAARLKAAFIYLRGLRREICRSAGKTILQSGLVIAAFICFSPNAARADIFVNTTSDALVAGACENAPAPGCSLRGAITASLNGFSSRIFFNIPAADPGCSAGACTINITQALPTINRSMTISGPGTEKLTIRDSAGNLPVSIFTFTGTADVIIGALTISNGFTGGIRALTSGNVRIDKVVLRNNRLNLGSAVLVTQGTVEVVDSLITGNIFGTAIHASGGLLRINNCTISNNAVRGVGSSNNGAVEIKNSTVSHNGWIGVENTSSLPFGVQSTIIALNNGTTGAPDVSGNFFTLGFNLIGRRDGSTGFTHATDQTGTIAAPLDPKFDPAGLRDNGGRFHTVALRHNSPALDKGFSGQPGRFDPRGRLFLRTIDYPAVPNAAGGDGTDIGAIESGTFPFDFDGDARTDLSIFRSAPGEWWVNRSADGSSFVAQFGVSTDRIVPADYTGDGKTDVAVWRPGTGQWFILRSENSTFYAFPFGTSGDIPAPGDYDGDWRADAAVFRPSTGTWFIQNSGGSGTSIGQFGTAGDKPIAADYDGDSRADIAIFRPGDGSWWYRRSQDGQHRVFRFGVSTDKPVPGDYTGDKIADIAVFRPATGEWFVQRSENYSFYSVPFGAPGDIPAPGDYDGDNRFDTAVFRPSGGSWFVQRSSAGILIQQFGGGGDAPVPNAFVP